MASEQSVLFCQSEIESLNGVGPLALSIYFWLRSWADWETAIVGRSRRISREMLAAYCERHVPRGKGVEIFRPTVKEVRNALEALERADLIERKSTELLVFSLTKAPKAQERSKQTGPSAGRLEGTEPGREQGENSADGLSLSDAGFDGSAAGEPGREPGRAFSSNRAYISSHSKPPSTTVVGISTVVPHANSESTEFGSAESVDPLAKIIGIDPSAVAAARALSEAIGSRINAMHPEVMRIAEMSASVEQIAKAVARARRIRADEGSHQPLNLAFIRSNLSAVMLEGRVRAPIGWGSDVRVAQGYARQLGLPHPEGISGESFETFKARISAFVRAAEQRREQA